MKPFLAVDKTNDKNNLELTGDNFKVEELPEDAFDSLDEAEAVVAELIKKKRLPRAIPYIFIINLVLTWGSFLSLFKISTFKYLGNSRTEILVNLFNEHPWLYLVCFASVAFTFFSIKYLFPKKKKEIESDEEIKLANDRVAAIENSLESRLGVSMDAVKVDIFSFNYKTKDNVFKPFVNGRATNCEFKMFLENGKLCLVEISSGKYVIPYTSIKSIREEKGNIAFYMWNKEEKYNDEKYKKYKIAYDTHLRMYSVKKYYVVELDVNGEAWGIFVPPYEAETFKRVLGC
ncbi:MAG: hypothetical protein IKK46_09755 [Clostridia bacterium]|nr:hypothetical protein [Clostridia bacterium]